MIHSKFHMYSYTNKIKSNFFPIKHLEFICCLDFPNLHLKQKNLVAFAIHIQITQSRAQKLEVLLNIQCFTKLKE